MSESSVDQPPQHQLHTFPVGESPQDPDDIASLVSYELRTPLTSIRAALGLLLTGTLGTLPEKGQRMLEIALSNTDRLMRLVEILERDPEVSSSTLSLQESPDGDADALAKRLVPLSLWRQRICYDKLTGLANQTLFMEWLKCAIARCEPQQQTPAVLLLGLDRFQIINDSLGRIIGDQLLKAIARRLEGCLQSTGAIARLQEDEFAIILEGVQDISAAVAIANSIKQHLTLPFNLDGQEVFITASVGIAWSKRGYEHPEDLLHDADTAMHRAKNLGKARHEIFDAGVRVEATSRLRLETDLRLALERQELQLYYQPIVSLSTNSITGFEALIRWQHPERGMVPPTKFIPLAEETGLIDQIGYWVMRTACKQLHIWQQQFPSDPPLTVSVNLSAKQFSQSDLVEQVQQILQETGLDPHSLRLEVTEGAIMESPDVTATMLQQLKALGIQAYVDDFGTGYSSLSYLHRFPIDTLKIDSSFIQRIDSEGEQLEIVQAIVKLAWNLGMNVIAEGVETRKQLSQLKALKCEYVQGYFFSKPINREAVEALISQGFILDS